MTEQEAIKQIAENVKEIERLVKESKELSKEHELDFSVTDIGCITDDMYDGGWSDSNC